MPEVTCRKAITGKDGGMRSYKIMGALLVLWMGLGTVGMTTTWAEENPRYKIIMSKNERLCTHVREVLNDDLINYGQGYDERKFGAPIFSTIIWKPIKGLEEALNYHGDVTHVDINNDGTRDAIIREETHTGNGVAAQMLFVYKEDQYPELAMKARELEEKSVGWIIPHLYEFRQLPQRTFKAPGVLKGKKYYEGLSSAVFIHPFQFEKRIYVLLTQSPDSPADPNWALVANYKQGKVREADPAMMDDVCYLKLKE